ncbi:MAG: hypothetical protein ABW115_19785 [Candidatus Thiodiazotropha sp. 6PLUC6]
MTEDERDKNRDRLAKRLEIIQRLLTIIGILTGTLVWVIEKLV